MAAMFHDTVLGYVLGLDSKSKKPLEKHPSWWLSSEKYKLSLKLESARIPAHCRDVRREAVYVDDEVSIKKWPSVASDRSDDSEASRRQCAAADRAVGWDGPDDPQVRCPCCLEASSRA